MLVVGSSGALSATDVVVESALVAEGFSVTVVDDSAPVSTGFDLVVLGESIASWAVSDYHLESMPVLYLSPSVAGDFGLNSWSSSHATTDVVLSSHDLAAGLSGVVDLTASGDGVATFVPSAATGHLPASP